jgi:hypothetical protein
MHVYLFDEPIPVAGFISINGLLFRETSSNHFEIERASKSSPISLEICEESILIQSKLTENEDKQLHAALIVSEATSLDKFSWQGWPQVWISGSPPIALKDLVEINNVSVISSNGDVGLVMYENVLYRFGFAITPAFGTTSFICLEFSKEQKSDESVKEALNGLLAKLKNFNFKLVARRKS